MTTEELKKFQAEILGQMEGEYKDIFDEWYRNADPEEIQSICFLGWAVNHVIEFE